MKEMAAAATIYTDMTGLSELKRQARNPSGSGTQAAARQFEAVFVEMMLKSLRQATPHSEFLDGAQTQTFRELHDKQLAQNLAATGKFGLGRLLARQLQREQKTPSTNGLQSFKPKAFPLHMAPKAIPLHTQKALKQIEHAAAPVGNAPTRPINSPAEFIEKMRPHAEAAAAELGVSPEVLLAQSALESGWGKRVMHLPGGVSSHNLFGIKANADWQGKQVNTKTLEYESGFMRRNGSRFRAYDSYAQSFRDYVNFIKGNPRYAQALQQADDPGAYLSSLQAAGYATDPNYANKVQRIMQHDAIRSSGIVASNKPVNDRA